MFGFEMFDDDDVLQDRNLAFRGNEETKNDNQAALCRSADLSIIGERQAE